MPENDAQCVIPVKRTSDHSVRWSDEMADRFEDVSDEDIELLLGKNGMVLLSHVKQSLHNYIWIMPGQLCDTGFL